MNTHIDLRTVEIVHIPAGTLVKPRKTGDKILDREVGKTTGTFRDCTLEGCRGLRIGVKWINGKLTWPCSKGCSIESDHIQIE